MSFRNTTMIPVSSLKYAVKKFIIVSVMKKQSIAKLVQSVGRIPQSAFKKEIEYGTSNVEYIKQMKFKKSHEDLNQPSGHNTRFAALLY